MMVSTPIPMQMKFVTDWITIVTIQPQWKWVPECYDDDGDGFCESPPCLDFTKNQSDCNDIYEQVHPNATEIPNNIDDDCDGYIDEGTAQYDDDGDGFAKCHLVAIAIVWKWIVLTLMPIFPPRNQKSVEIELDNNFATTNSMKKMQKDVLDSI